MNLVIDTEGLDGTDGTDGILAVGIKPELREASDVEMPPDLPAAPIGFLPDDEYVVTGGGLAGQRGYFSRTPDGTITGIDLAGRLFTRAAGQPRGSR